MQKKEPFYIWCNKISNCCVKFKNRSVSALEYMLIISGNVYSKYSFNFRLRLGWRSFFSALASIWRIRSRVTLNSRPISSNVRLLPSSRTNLNWSTRWSQGVRGESYFWVAKQVFWRTGTELPRWYGLYGGFWPGLTIGFAGYTICVKTREERG